MSSTRAHRLALVAAVVALAAAAPARASETTWRLRIDAGPGVDANPLRIVGDATPSTSAFTGGSLGAQGRVSGGGWSIDGRLSEGFRIFNGASDADLVVSRLDAAARWFATHRLELGLDGMARDLTERGGARDLREAQALARASVSTGRVRWGAAAGWTVSVPRAGGLGVFRRDGPELSLSAAVRVAREHAIAASWVFDAWRYRDWPGSRDDDEHEAALEWRWDGPVLTGLGYAFERNVSSDRASSWRRHRVTARLAADLPLGLDLAARGTLQRSDTSSSIIVIEEQFFVREGDESQNAVEVQVARELRTGVEIAFKVAHYRSELGAEAGLGFRRTVAQATLAWTVGR